MSGELVLSAMPREEGHINALEGSHPEFGRRLAVRSFYGYELGIVEEVVKARATKYADHQCAFLDRGKW